MQALDFLVQVVDRSCGLRVGVDGGGLLAGADDDGLLCSGSLKGGGTGGGLLGGGVGDGLRCLSVPGMYNMSFE